MHVCSGCNPVMGECVLRMSEGQCHTLRMAAVSSISAMKVEMPLSWQSPAPTRAKMQSRTAMVALSHGTKLPTCAISTFTPAYKHTAKLCWVSTRSCGDDAEAGAA